MAAHAERPSQELSAASLFGDAKQAASYSIVVVIPANHAVAFDRVSELLSRRGDDECEVIVACAGQPVDRQSIHTHLKDAHFLLAPAEASRRELRRLATGRTTGDIVTFVDPTAEPRGAPSASQLTPVLSVVVPVRDGGTALADTLESLVASDMPRSDYEIIVVDDSSADASATTAAQFADILVRLAGGSRGAAYARNRGAERAAGDVLVFVDAGVRVRRDTLSQLLAALDDDASAAAIAATNDGSSGDGGVPTQYWNLLQQHGAAVARAPQIHFSASCGAIRREPFLTVGMFDEWHFAGSTIEDLELGDRLHRAGYRVVLSKDIQVGSVGQHGLARVLRQGWGRSRIATQLLGFGRSARLARSHAIYALGSVKGVVATLGAGAAVAAAVRPSLATFSVAGVALVALAWGNAGAFTFFSRRRGVTFAIAAMPLHVAMQMAVAGGRVAGWILRNAVGNPAPDATTQAFAEIGVTRWPPVPRRPS